MIFIHSTMLSRLVIISLLVLLYSCASNQTFHTTGKKKDYWQLQGRMLVASETETWHMKIFWKQQGDSFQIRFTTPLGNTRLQLSGDQQQVEMIAENKKYMAKDLDSLLAQHTDWKIPVQELSSWLFAAPYPDEIYQAESDNQGRLATLQQNGWLVRYKKYMQLAEKSYPRNISLVYAGEQEVKIKLVISNWQFGKTDGRE